MATSSAIAWRGSQAVFLHSRVASTPLLRRCRLFGMSFFRHREIYQSDVRPVKGAA